MKTNYFSKVENKYVFNVSLIFWHILIALATLAIVFCIIVFLWGTIPAIQKNVMKQSYPEKKEYPVPITVTLTELNLDDLKKEEFPEIDQNKTASQPLEKKPMEDLSGKIEYEASLDTLKILIPPAQYSWEGQGYWNYPQGKRFWDVYKREIYRQWISTEGGVTDKLNTSYRKANATNFIEKKQLLDNYIKVIKLFPENKRLNVLQIIMINVASNMQRNNDILNSLVNVVKKMDKTENINVIDLLTSFGKDNPNDGIPFINYIATIIDKFDKTQQYKGVENLKNGFYWYFNQNLKIQQEATDLYIPMLSQMKIDQQAQTLFQYYSLYLNKNEKRNEQIRQIDFEHQQAINEIESKYLSDQQQAQMDFEAKKAKKERLRLRALSGIGGGIILVVLIATFLAFLSIQRSVRKMEEKMTNSNE